MAEKNSALVTESPFDDSNRPANRPNNSKPYGQQSVKKGFFQSNA